MKVRLIKYGILKNILPDAEWNTDRSKATVRDIIEELCAAYPDLSKYKFVTAINDSVVDDRQTVSNGDLLFLIPPFAGG